MGITGERIAQTYSITRKEEEAFSLNSHEKAFYATKDGRFKEEIIAVKIRGIAVEKDKGMRRR
jgi:acetyl-CoA acetyltransferase